MALAVLSVAAAGRSVVPKLARLIDRAPWLPVLVAAVAFFLIAHVNRWVHDPPYMQGTRARPRVDAVGISLLTVGLASLQTVLEEGQINDWFSSPVITVLTIVVLQVPTTVLLRRSGTWHQVFAPTSPTPSTLRPPPTGPSC